MRTLQRALFIVAALYLSMPFKVAEAFECVSDLPKKGHGAILKGVEQRYREFQTLQAEFVQESYLIGLNKKDDSRGQVQFKKPGKMFWSYEKPEPQKFVTDGETLWFHQPELNQVTIGNFVNAFQSDLPVSFLLGIGQLSKDFSILKACETKSGILVELEPNTPDKSLHQFFLLVAKKKSSLSQYTPIGAKLVDVGGNETKISFENISLNKKLGDKRFDFTIPLGVDVIDRRANRSFSAAVDRPEIVQRPAKAEEGAKVEEEIEDEDEE